MQFLAGLFTKSLHMSFEVKFCISVREEKV